MTAEVESHPSRPTLLARLFARRGWLMAIPLLALLGMRAYSDAPLQLWGLLAIGLGIALRAWAGLHIGSHTNGHEAEAPSLCTTGPYALMRHPLYFANTLIALGLLLFANAMPWVMSLLVLLVVALFYGLLAKHEETMLAQRFGEVFANYRQKTFLQKIRAWFSNRDSLNENRDTLNQTSQTSQATLTLRFRALWERQARNMGYTVLATLLIAILAGWSKP